MRTRRQALAAKPEAAREMPDETAAGKRKPKANSYMLKRLTDSREDEVLEDEMHAAMQENDVLADGVSLLCPAFLACEPLRHAESQDVKINDIAESAMPIA